MPWTGKEAYNVAEWKDWKVDGHLAGVSKQHANLKVLCIFMSRSRTINTRQLLKVYGAGHLVPTDQPEVREAVSLTTKWEADECAECAADAERMDGGGLVSHCHRLAAHEKEIEARCSVYDVQGKVVNADE